MRDSNDILGPSGSPETGELIKALGKAQADYPVVAFDSANPHFKSKFASYAACCEALRGPLTRNGLALPDFRPGLVGGQWIVVGTLRHSSGQWISGIAPLLMGKGDMQGFGAAMTYAKRTLLMALCGGFTGEPDEDGNSIVGKQEPQHLAYQQGAINAITDAKTKEEAQKHLDLVNLRVREKHLPKSVFDKCQSVFDEKWTKA